MAAWIYPNKPDQSSINNNLGAGLCAQGEICTPRWGFAGQPKRGLEADVGMTNTQNPTWFSLDFKLCNRRAYKELLCPELWNSGGCSAEVGMVREKINVTCRSSG